jgi:hypothetical protein
MVESTTVYGNGFFLLRKLNYVCIFGFVLYNILSNKIRIWNYVSLFCFEYVTWIYNLKLFKKLSAWNILYEKIIV